MNIRESKSNSITGKQGNFKKVKKTIEFGFNLLVFGCFVKKTYFLLSFELFKYSIQREQKREHFFGEEKEVHAF